MGSQDLVTTMPSVSTLRGHTAVSAETDIPSTVSPAHVRYTNYARENHHQRVSVSVSL